MMILQLNYYLVEASCNENNKTSSKVLIKAGFIKDGYIANRRINLDGTYSGVEYYSKKK
jgi:RimJ/RimL family protein N-acetyltransferase